MNGFMQGGLVGPVSQQAAKKNFNLLNLWVKTGLNEGYRL